MKVIVTLICIAVSIGLCGCDLNVTYDVTKLRPNLPEYPNAKQVQVQENFSDPSNNGYTRVTTFQTQDNTITVLGFFEKELLKDGWHTTNTTTPTPNKAYYTKNLGINKPTYSLVISTKKLSEGSVEVELNLGEYIPH